MKLQETLEALEKSTKDLTKSVEDAKPVEDAKTEEAPAEAPKEAEPEAPKEAEPEAPAEAPTDDTGEAKPLLYLINPAFQFIHVDPRLGGEKHVDLDRPF